MARLLFALFFAFICLDAPSVPHYEYSRATPMKSIIMIADGEAKPMNVYENIDGIASSAGDAMRRLDSEWGGQRHQGHRNILARSSAYQYIFAHV